MGNKILTATLLLVSASAMNAANTPERGLQAGDSLDLWITSINYAGSLYAYDLYPDSKIKIGCTVESFSSHHTYADFYFTITSLTTNQVVYTDTLYVNALAPGKTVVYSHKPFSSQDVDSFMIFARVSNPYDTVARNDTASRKLRLERPPHFPSIVSGTAGLNYAIPKPMVVHLALYDFRGALIETILSGNYCAGSHSIQKDFSTLPAGIYFTRFIVPDSSFYIDYTSKLVVIH